MDRVDYQKALVQDLINDHKSGTLNLEPWYQRRSVWNQQQKAFLINTIFEQKPIPSFYIRHSIDVEKQKSLKEVVDGQQRLRSIIEYCDDKFAAPHPDYENFKYKFSDLKKSEKAVFLGTSLSVGFLIGADEADVIDIFGRINSVAKTLNAQEKRNAEYSGEFKQFSLKYASGLVQFWRNNSIFTATQIARMEEIQFVSDLVLNFINGLSDFNPRALDRAYAKYDEKFAQRGKIKKRLDDVFGSIAELESGIITDTIFSRSPLFFSLLMVLDELRISSKSKIEKVILKVDSHFNSDIPQHKRSKKEADFYTACTSTTQRIKHRKIRHEYIKSFF